MLLATRISAEHWHSCTMQFTLRLTPAPHQSISLPSSCSSHPLPGATGGLDCVRILHPELHGASALIAAGSRDSSVYVWRKRAGGEEEGGRSMRSFTGAVMSGHRVRCTYILCFAFMYFKC